MRTALACLVAVVAMGCDGTAPPSVELDDAGGAGPDAGIDGIPWVPDLLDEPLTDVPFRSGSLPLPRDAWTDPPQCGTASSNEYCEECWEWTDAGPWSLGRNATGDRFGTVAAGDFNGDGYPDLAVGAPGEADSTYTDVGRVYVYLGSAAGFQPWFSVGVSDFSVSAANDLELGAALASADFNDDGLADLAIAFGGVAPSSSLAVAYGNAAGLGGFETLALADMDPDSSSASIGVGDALGVGDFDADGAIDLAVGVPEYPTAGKTEGGAVVIVYGGPSGLDPTLRTGTRLDLDASALDNDRFGASLAVPEGDGMSGDMLAIGIPGAGKVATFDESGLLGGPWSSMTSLGSTFGTQVAAGDLDGDGAPEIIASAASGSHMEIAGTTTQIATIDSRGSVAIHPLAVVDLDNDGDQDLVAVSAPPSSAPFAPLLYHGDGTTGPDSWAQLDASSREADDELGIQVAITDANGDVLPDLVFGAPGPASSSAAGRAYYDWVEYGSDWSTAPAPAQVVDQETALDCELCYVQEWPDGTICDDGTGDEICVFGACVTRDCGDGYREPYGSAWGRESCDDGNVADGDACSSTCGSERLIISSRAGGDDSPSRLAPAAAEDGNRDVLFVYAANAGEMLELRARRFNYGGAAPSTDPGYFVLADELSLGWDPQASVAGLPGGGWIVAWTDPNADGAGQGIALRHIRPDGTVLRVRVANEDARGEQYEPRVAALDTGYVVVWTDASGFDGPFGRTLVEARRFDDTDRAIEDEWPVSDPALTSSQPALAAIGDRFLVAWVDTPDGPFGDPTVLARRFGGSGDDADSFVVSDATGAEPALAVLGTGFVAAWSHREDDFRGDIASRVIAAEGDALASSTAQTIASTASRSELAPSIAPLTSAEYLVAYEDGGARRNVAFAHVGVSGLAAESSDLTDWLAAGLQGDVTLLGTWRGVWFAWSDATAFGNADAYRSFLAFLLPLD
jgi:cysteine-rich repeat protein